MVLDECEFIPEFLDALSAGGGTTPQKRLIYTSRESSNVIPSFEVPPLTKEEAREIVRRSGIAAEIAPGIVETGNPLQLHEALLKEALDPTTSGLSQIEGPAGEVLRYVALSDVPLSAEDILFLRADDRYSIEMLHSDMNQLRSLVDDSPRGFRVMHQETASLISNELRESPQRYRFYINRLIRLFQRAGDLARVYQLACGLNDGTEKKYAAAAAREAIRLGNWRLGANLIDQLLGEALDTESKAEAFYLMLSLSYPLELMGDAQLAADLLDRARPLAEALGASFQTRIQEAQLCSKARRGLSAEDVAAMKHIHKTYGDQQQFWDQARIGLELSAIYISAKEFEQARDILQPTLETFEALGDDYGIDLAQRNLASALSELPGNDEEAEQLIRTIEERMRYEPDVRRQRAWLCNILTRRLRRAARYEEAETLATEAIDIGSALGDEYLRAINLINLGNNHRDQHHANEAIGAYESAAVSAQKCGRRDLEGDSSRLIAGIYNDFPELDGKENRHARARFYAQHAVGLLRETMNYDALACALVELAGAQKELRERAQAAAALFEAAKNFAEVPDEEDSGEALLRGSILALPDYVELYLERLADGLMVARPNSQLALADQFLALIKPLIERSPRGVLMPLLGRHLYEIFSHLPESMGNALVLAIIRTLESLPKNGKSGFEPRRVLYANIVLSFLLKDRSHSFLHSRLAQCVTRCVDDVFVRQEDYGSRIWTVVINLKRRVVVTISALDETPESSVAGFALAMFIKASEGELRRELISRATDVDELMIHLCQIDHMPDDLRTLANQTLNLREALEKNGCAVTRPTQFDGPSPTFVFLGSTFFPGISFGEGRGGSLQTLFGFTLVELTFQLLQGQVEMDAIRPKVVSLVRRTIS
jgi:hypothetical protein